MRPRLGGRGTSSTGGVFIAFFIALLFLLFLLLLFGLDRKDGLDVRPVGGTVSFHVGAGDKVHVVTGDKVEVVKWRELSEVLRHEQVLEVKLERVRVGLLENVVGDIDGDALGTRAGEWCAFLVQTPHLVGNAGLACSGARPAQRRLR